ncbi:cell division protein FtsZ [Sphingobacterium faecium]|jgi:cell division protein FtsZ|uniref:cell division protein FtsZ n=1 Tax=Sphingobacterium faecium TaxID=34087 RepID=UPI000B9B1DFF|nr:cell division protein FtsZ [Sphingobacterium faecium]UXD68367.1 cell division protein FtsZ [Sphingobacterium faecium]WGQ16070.1 cell division protein FtsZ [Sphingobacterium faecium]HCU45006.1 cell division protein FtsZ [Sphingobacterium sp.]
MSIQFEMLKEQSSIIKVIGVGGGGGNAVNHMYKQGISGVDFIVCNTDAQALELSPIPNKVQLGMSLTEGMGAGADPDVGENSAIESIDDIKRMLGTNTKMLFITAGMGGGTGTGASPVLAKAAKELGILTVAIITTPFTFEGKRRRSQAEEGLSELRKYVDSYLVISNDRLREIFGNLTMTAAFAKADDILTTAAKGIAEIITIPGYVNVDFKDVRTVMNDSGVAIMGNAVAEGEDRAIKAVEGALASPLLKDNEIEGARYILLNITSGLKEVTMDEVAIITDYIQEKAGLSADLIWGNCIDENFGEELSVTIIATGFQTSEERDLERENTKVTMPLTAAEQVASFIKPVNQFVQKEVSNTPLVNPVQTNTENFSAPTTTNDLFSTPKNVVQQQAQVKVEENAIIRHELNFEEVVEEESSFMQKGNDFQLKTSPSVFQFQMPTVFDEYATGSVSAQEEQNNNFSASVNNKAEIEQVEEEQVSFEDQLVRTKERILRLKELSMKLKSSNGLQELENEPAYKRKQMSLDDTPHSSQSQVSRFTLSFEDGNTEIRPNNSFLHDNVD